MTRLEMHPQPLREYLGITGILVLSTPNLRTDHGLLLNLIQKVN